MQSLKKNLRAGLVTLGVIVAVVAVFLTPGFITPPSSTFTSSFEVENKEVVKTSGLHEAVVQSAEAVFGMVKKTSLQ